MKIYVTGGTGLLGFHLIKILAEKGFDIYASYHEHSPVYREGIKWIYVNLEETESIGETIRATNPDVIIHSAAYTDVDGCEINKSLAYRVNYLAVEALARSALKNNSFMVYISTDYVFDGERGMYREEDIPNPVNFYGLTKLLGEVAVKNILSEKSLIIRISGLYGYSPTGKKNFGLNALEKLIQGKEVVAFYDQFLSPTYAYHLAYRVAKAVEEGVSGYLHMAGERMSRLGFVLTLIEVLRVDKNLVRPASISEAKLVAKRPRDSSLDTSNAHSLGLALPPQIECIKHFVEYYNRKSFTGV